MSKKNSKRRVWRGVTTATASLLALSVCASTVVDGFRTDIDKFLGTKSTKLVTEDTDGVDLYTFKSDYTSTTDLLHGIQDVGERMSEEGSVLLKNNGALPLTKDETQKITLLGFSSYYPVQGGDMGSSLSENTGTDADTVDMVQAFKAKGFGLNQTVADMYEALQPTFKSEVQSWGGVKEYNHITAPSTSGVFSSKEPSQAALDGQNAAWKDSMNDNNVMIVTIARSASENGTYMPGTAGVDPTQNLNQTDPLGLSDDERDLIQAAVDAKASNGGKVIVLLNNASAMEVQEIQDNAGVDAILQIGLPGGYGFYGVADILSGDVNPSGHLTDTYAVKNANSPAAQNFGDLQWTNANPDIQMNDAIVEAENIYIGYKYYETRYFDTVMNQGNAASTVGSSTGSAWNYDDEVTYPFGYGLSYTTFTQTLDDLNVDLDNETVTAKVTVTNTGSVAGKDAVQVYFNPPYTDGGIEKASANLVTFGKTDSIEPGASQTLTLTFNTEDMASFDSKDKGCYVLEEGDYIISINEDSHTVLDSKTYNVASTIVYDESNPRSTDAEAATTKFDFADDKLVTLSRAGHFANYAEAVAAPSDFTMSEESMNTLYNDHNWNPEDFNDPNDEMPVTGANNGLKLADLRGADYDDERWDTLLDQMTVTEMDDLIALGGYQTKAEASVDKYATIDCDGPAAINNNFTGVSSIGFPSEIIIASTFNTDLARRYGESIGRMASEMNVTGWYAPAMNGHRSAFDGRNFEYYSEDSVLAGYIGASSIAGAQSYGVYAYMKHFALNDQQINQNEMLCTWADEQAIREIYLRPFEISAKVGGCKAVMSSWNYIGNQWAGACNALLNGVLRGEWGFRGMVITDGFHFTDYMDSDIAIRNGCDLMLKNYDVATNHLTDTTSATSVKAMRQACKNIMYTVVNSRVYDPANTVSTPIWRTAMIVVDVLLAVLLVVLEVLTFKSYKKKKAQ